MAKWQLPPPGGHMDKPTGLYMQNMTGQQIQERLKQNDLIIVPLGSTENHGPHGPNGEDVFLVSRMAELVARAHRMHRRSTRLVRLPPISPPRHAPDGRRARGDVHRLPARRDSRLVERRLSQADHS